MFGMMVDIGLKFLSAPSPPGGTLGSRLRTLNFHKKVKVFCV